VGEKDWEVKENANMGFSLQGLNNFITDKIVKDYWLGRIYPENIKNAHDRGDLHIHDLGVLGPYCVGWDLKDLLLKGFTGVPGKVQSRPAKHLRTALGQVVNFFFTLQGEAAGAQAFSNFDTFLAPFIKYDNLDYDQIKQCLQEFCFNMAVPTRVGFQSPFTNITLDLKVPEHMKTDKIIIGGQQREETYGQFQNEMDLFNKAFAETMIEGDASGRVFTFPIPTYNITKDFDWDNKNYEPIWEMTAKYGIPYFSNFINSDMKPEDARSMCCRLRLDNKELLKRGGGLFGANPKTGSIGVVTLNMARIGYLSSNETEFFSNLENLMDITKDSLEIKRKVLENFIRKGLYPYSKFFLEDINQAYKEYWYNHFSTIGLLGMNEALNNFMNTNIATPEGTNFTLKVLDFMRDKLSDYQAETGHNYNLEATPGEGTTYRFATLDKNKFKDILVANEKKLGNGTKPYYSNSTHLPVNYTDDPFEALELQDPLQVKYTGGTVLHLFLGERIEKEAVPLLVKKVSEKFHLPYFTLTPTFSICPHHGYLAGEHEYCPKCELIPDKEVKLENENKM
jgi:ribonucleoside-triphosphate reductase (formate)